jgi:hypothetical protein
VSPRSPGSAARGWSGPRPYVGRDAVLAELLEAADVAMAEGGRAVFLLGEAGSGRTACLGVLEELAHRRHSGLRTGYAECSADDEKTSAWLRLDEHFTYATRMRRAALALVPDWLEVVPVIGPIAAATMVTVQRLRGRAIHPKRRTRQTESASVLDHVRSLVEHGETRPLLILLDDLERASADDLAGASALIRRLQGTRILLVVAARTVNGRPEGPVASVLREAERQPGTRQVHLPGFDRDELLEVVSLLVRGMIPPEWLDWLAAETAGRPGLLWDRLGSLEAAGQLRKAGKTWAFHGEPPRGESPELETLAGPMEEGTRRLLALAALEGDAFHSAVLAELTGIEELEIEDRLAPLVRKGLLNYLGESDAGSEPTSRYSFRDPREGAVFETVLPAEDREAGRSRAAEVRRALGLMNATA